MRAAEKITAAKKAWRLEFEWDEAKRLTNLDKHELDFGDVDQVFDGATIEAPATSRVEARLMVTGILEGRHVTVICTYRGGICRVISFRRARRAERRRHQALYG